MCEWFSFLYAKSRIVKDLHALLSKKITGFTYSINGMAVRGQLITIKDRLVPREATLINLL